MSEKQNAADLEIEPDDSEESEVRLSELEQPVWSVISFDKCVAADLTYAQASEQIARLTDEKISGLCIVTNEAAGRLGQSKKLVI